MATGGANYSTAGTDRFNEIQFLLHQGCTKLLRAVVRHLVELEKPDSVPPLAWSLNHFLLHRRKQILHTEPGKKNVLVKKQYGNVLYPPDGSESNLENWDLYLLCHFIRQIFDPPTIEYSDMGQIKTIRNDLSHCRDTNLDEQVYNDYVRRLDAIMDRTLKMLKDQELAICLGELRLLADEEKHRNPKHVPILLKLCDDSGKTHQKLDEINKKVDASHKKLDDNSADNEEMLSILRRVDHQLLGGREIDLLVYLSNCPTEQHDELCKILVEKIDPEVRNDARLNSELSPESIESLNTIITKVVKIVCTNGRTVLSAVKKCVAIRVRCDTVDSLCDLVEQSVNGELTRIFLPVQTFLRTLPGYDTLEMEVHVTQESFSMTMHEIVNDLVQLEGKVRDTHDVETEMVESCIKRVTLEPYGQSEDKRIKIHIKPSSDEHLQHIREICRSGQLNKHLAEVADVLKSVYGSNLAINAQLGEESSPHIDTGGASGGLNGASGGPNGASGGPNGAGGGPNGASGGPNGDDGRPDVDGEGPDDLADGDEVPREDPLPDIRKHLLAKYDEDLSTISMPPFLQRIRPNIDDVYTELLIRDDLVHQQKKLPVLNRNRIENYQAILTDDDGKPCKNIYVVGKAGIGKTTWSRKLVSTWCDVINKDEGATVSTIDKSTLQRYDLLFYIELRQAKRNSAILEMIESQLFPHQPALMTSVKTLMERELYSSRCLIVLDGLDEWVSRDQSTTNDGLPDQDPRWKSTIITTTRSWKLEQLQLEPRKIDRAIEIRGLLDDDANQLVKKAITTLNVSTGKNKDVEEFKAHCHQSIHQCLNVPLLLNIFVCLWYDEGQIDELLARTFCGLVELLLKHAEGDAKRGLIQKISPEKLNKAKQTWKKNHSGVPDFLAKRRLCTLYAPFLNRLGKLAFESLFSRSRESTLVFDFQSVKDFISEEELELALNTGLLSQTIYCGSVLEKEFSLSFLHKTVQEYLAALYMVYDGTQSTACLNRYKEYSTDAYKVLEMENILMFVSGMCPEMAGKMSCHIACMESNAAVHQLLLQCVRQEHIVCSTSTHIYIKHHFLYASHESHSDTLHPSFGSRTDTLNYNTDTISLLSASKGKDTTLCLNKDVDDEIAKRIADIRHVKLVEAQFHFGPEQCIQLDFGEPFSQMSLTRAESTCLQIRLSAAYLKTLDIVSYKSTSEQLDLSGCKSLKTVGYTQSTAQIRLPTEQLEKVTITDYKPSTVSVLDLSGCKSLRTILYEQSTAPIQLPTEKLEIVEINGYTSSNESVLDLSGCKSLRTLRFDQSTVPIQLPTEQLEKVVINGYTPSTVSVLDLSGCTALRSVHYEQSTVPIQLPTEQLENVEINGYTSSTESVLDLSGCKSLRSIRYEQSTVPIQLPTEQLEKVEINGYTLSTESMLDMSGCKSLISMRYELSTVQIQLPTEQLKKVEIIDYTPSTESMLDMSGCKFLRTLRFEQSTAPIQLPTEQLEKVVIDGYTPSKVSVLDMSGCKSLRTLRFEQSTSPIQLPTEQLENIEITGYTPSTVSVLDMSGCKLLRTVRYGWSSAPIQLPTEQLEKVEIDGYTSSTESVLDLSGCKSLRTVHYEQSTVPIQLPTEQLEKVEITSYTPGTESVLDLSGCKSLITVHYEQSTVPIQLPTEQLENIEITGYTPTTVSVLDLSGCKSLRTLRYKQSTTPIQLPTEQLENVEITGYTPTTVSVLDLSGCKSLRTLRYKQSTTPIQLPTEQLVNVEITDYTPSTVSVLDLSGCKSLGTLRYKQSTAPIQLPTEQLEEVEITGYKPSTVSVLDLSGCTSIAKFMYFNSFVPIKLPNKPIKHLRTDESCTILINSQQQVNMIDFSM